MLTAKMTMRRSGFTLVELMVVCAICVIIMAVLASIFGTGTEAVRQVRSAGEMMDQLRAAGEVIKIDMQGSANHNIRIPHFTPNPIPGQSNDRIRLSDYRFNFGESAPSGGFFRIESPPTLIEGVDAEFIQSGRATNHRLHFTTRLSGGSDQNLYSVTVGTVTFTSPAAEIAYFLVPETGRFTNGPGSIQLFQLIRRHRLIATNPADMQLFQQILNNDPNAHEVISGHLNPGKPPPVWLANTMTDVTNPVNRLGGASSPPAGWNALVARAGDDVLLSNVISFEVKPVWDYATAATATRAYPPAGTGPGSGTYAPGNSTDDPSIASGPNYFPYSTDSPYDNLARHHGGVFDTGGAFVVPTPIAPTIRVKGVQIRLRVFDAKLKNARQSSFVIDL